MENARVLIDPPLAGARNMAIDQALLDSANDHGCLTIRIYQWQSPTLSLGYFQRYQDRHFHVASMDCSVVRRSTGGGAILHDDEITYSICIPSQHRWSRSHDRLYYLAHDALIELLEGYGVVAQRFAGPPRRGKPEFLCFRRRSDGDIVLQGCKIGGSAQRRKRDALLQHGSFLIRQSEFAPELPGVNDLAGVSINKTDFAGRLVKALASRLGVAAREGRLDPQETDTAKLVEEQVYASTQWTQKR